jgi:hypothetical protein
LRSQKMGWLLYSLELETMTNGQLNGYSYFEDTKRRGTGKGVVEQKWLRKLIRTIVCGLDLKQVLMTQDTKQKT